MLKIFNSEKINHFEKLPDEITLSIFAFLDPITLLKIARVCKDFARLTDDPLLWKEKWNELNVKRFGIFQKPESFSKQWFKVLHLSHFVYSKVHPISFSFSETFQSFFWDHLQRQTQKVQKFNAFLNNLTALKKISFDTVLLDQSKTCKHLSIEEWKQIASLFSTSNPLPNLLVSVIKAQFPLATIQWLAECVNNYISTIPLQDTKARFVQELWDSCVQADQKNSPYFLNQFIDLKIPYDETIIVRFIRLDHYEDDILLKMVKGITTSLTQISVKEVIEQGRGDDLLLTIIDKIDSSINIKQCYEICNLIRSYNPKIQMKHADRFQKLISNCYSQKRIDSIDIYYAIEGRFSLEIIKEFIRRCKEINANNDWNVRSYGLIDAVRRIADHEKQMAVMRSIVDRDYNVWPVYIKYLKEKKANPDLIQYLEKVKKTQ